MKTTVYLHDLRTQFHQMGRGDQFSYDGLRVLFEALEQYEDDTGSEVELDVIAYVASIPRIPLRKLLRTMALS
jgi:hypothetical protein